jgi:VanZ family protein
MRGFLIIVWVSMILVLTCTSSFTKLVEYGQIQFQWNHKPNLSHLLLPLPVEISKSFLLQKFGHIMAFFTLSLLLQMKFKSKKLVLTVSITLSVLTEFLQLYFYRDGRLFDIGFDIFGILIALTIGAIFSPTNHNKFPIKRVP